MQKAALGLRVVHAAHGGFRRLAQSRSVSAVQCAHPLPLEPRHLGDEHALRHTVRCRLHPEAPLQHGHATPPFVERRARLAQRILLCAQLAPRRLALRVHVEQRIFRRAQLLLQVLLPAALLAQVVDDRAQ